MTVLRDSACPECGHSILNHKLGVCIVIVTLPLPKGMWGERAKAHCGCEHIKPQSPLQQVFIDFD